jgi:hypothetical protein
MRADVNRPVLAMLIVSLGALLASGCGACGSGSSAVGLPDGGVTAADRVDGGAGMLTQQACMRSCPASNAGLALSGCKLVPPDRPTEIDCYYDNHVMCLKNGKTD